MTALSNTNFALIVQRILAIKVTGSRKFSVKEQFYTEIMTL